MRAGLCGFILALTLFYSSLLGQTDDDVILSDEPFSFSLYTSDIFPWITGEKHGAVGTNKNAMVRQLEDLLLTARRRVALAFYGVSQQPWFLQTIATLLRRGVTVNAVVDQRRGAVGDWVAKNFTYAGTAELPQYIGLENIIVDLNAAGSHPRQSIMHHKYAVVDRERVWFGTANLSHAGVGAEYNANVALTISSPQVSTFFVHEFQQMFEQHRFSNAKLAQPGPRTVVFRDGTEVSVWFSPQDNVIDRTIIPALAKAQATIDIGMFYLTEHRVVDALCTAAVRGVKIRIIIDALANSQRSSPYWELWRCGVNIKVENWGGKMHMKTAVIDSKLTNSQVIVGSMNWSHAGNKRNDENLVIIRNNPQLTQELIDYFTKLWHTLRDKRQRRTIFAEALTSINSCFDGIDNDDDGQVDAQDRGCQHGNTTVR